MRANRWTIEHMADQTGRVAVVTGANSGIGFEAAKALAAKGATVVLACRDDEKGRGAVRAIVNHDPQGEAESMRLDLAELASVHAFADAFAGRFDRLDMLINNAGVMMPPSSTTEDEFELQFGVNHLGHFALTGRLLPVLLNTPSARVVTVSSGAHRYGSVDVDDPNWERRPYKAMASYGQSKLANLLFTLELQRRLTEAQAGVMALSAHPGWTGTNLQRHSGLFRRLNPLFSMEPRQGALPLLYAATADGVEPGGYYGPDGWMEWRGYPKRVGASEAAQDAETARRLWELSEELTAVTFELADGAATRP